jgi:membrane carboxypeptidase/penicillin-binding protein PbpC
MVVLANLGVESAVGVMQASGLKRLARGPHEYGLSLAIGGAEASPMELAQAYAMLGRGGTAIDVRVFSGSDGVPGGLSSSTAAPAAGDSRPPAREEFPGDSRTLVISKAACWQALSALSGVERTSAISPHAARLGVAWKTGTSSGHRDAWCAAVTRRRTVVVWLGNAGGQGSTALIGAEAAAPLALRLIANLDPGPSEPWPVEILSAGPRASAAMTPAPSGATALTVITPTSGQQYVVDPGLPLERQRVSLKAMIRSSQPGNGIESRTLWWFVDGEPVGVADANAQLWWAPVRGNHEIRVIDARGHAAVSQVLVR